MKKILYLLLVLPIITLFISCDGKDDIVFDHELQQFPDKENAILLEVIVPTGSLSNDEYYIIGDFNGGEDAIGNPEWQLEKAPESNLKWGIYLTPSSFLNGKTLADGFTFYAKEQGAERSVKNEPVIHSLNVEVGSFTNVWVNRWESYFGNVEKKSYNIYVNDQTGWDELALYAYGDAEPVVWPGMSPTGTKIINGVTYTIFELGEELKDLTLNLIFNNNGHGEQFDALSDFKVDRDVYLVITETGYEEVDPNVVPYAGYTVYVDDQSGWDELALYSWGDAELDDWPGIQPTGTKEINGVNYTYFQLGEEMNGKVLNLIFNNNSGAQFNALSDFKVDRDVYVRITENSYEEVDPDAEPESFDILKETNQHKPLRYAYNSPVQIFNTFGLHSLIITGMLV